MSHNFKIRWMIIAGVWAAVLALDLWNLAKIDSIWKLREKKEILMMDQRFWHSNAENMAQIAKKRASLIRNVESYKLGLFEFENQLKHIARKLDLKSFKLTSRPRSNQEGIIPVMVSFDSTFKQSLQWFDLLTVQVPYAQIGKVEIKVDTLSKRAEFEVSIDCRFNLSAKETSI